MKNKIISICILAAALLTSGILITKAQESNITFPIPELGSCNSKEECKTYCDNSSHMTECIAFAEKNGLMKKEEAERARQFKSKFESGEGGPGGCQSPRECEAFCRNIENIETCIAFAEKHGVEDKRIEQGKKILRYLKSGGKMPGSCNSKDSCDTYCGDFSHANECFAFAKSAGVAQEFEGGPQGGNAPSPEHFEKLMELTEKGETPGGCKSKTECETYCHEEGHGDECVAFGEKLGFIKPEEAERIRKSGFGGPGGCKSEESCRNFCNDPAHQEECFRSAEERGFISKGEIERMKEGTARFKVEVQRMPPEIAECVKSAVGEEVFAKIQTGTIPGPEVGERMHQCFEMVGPRGDNGIEGKIMPQSYPKDQYQNKEEENMQRPAIYREGFGPTLESEQYRTNKNRAPQMMPSEEYRKGMNQDIRGLYQNQRAPTPLDPRRESNEEKMYQNQEFMKNPQMMNSDERQMYLQKYPERQMPPVQKMPPQESAPQFQPGPGSPQPTSNAGSTNIQGSLLQSIKNLLSGIALR